MGNKKESKITIPLILKALGLVFYLLFLVAGCLYWMKGNFILLGIIVLVCFGLSFLASDFLEKAKVKNDSLKGGEITWRIIFTITLIFSFFVINHGIQIEFFEKDTIRKAARDKIQSVDNLIMDYNAEVTDRIDQLATSVEKDIDLFILSKGKNQDFAQNIESQVGEGAIDFDQFPKNISDKKLQTQAADAIQLTQDRMQQEFDLGEVVNQWENYRDQVQVIFNNWQRLQLGFYYYDIDNQYIQVYNATQTAMNNFDYAGVIPNTAEIHLDNPFYSLSNNGTFINLGIWLALLVMMLAPYIAADRKKKTGRVIPSGGFKINN